MKNRRARKTKLIPIGLQKKNYKKYNDTKIRITATCWMGENSNKLKFDYSKKVDQTLKERI